MDTFEDADLELTEEEKEERVPTKEQVVFLIDAQPRMLEPCGLDDPELENCSWMQAAIKVVAAVLRQKVIEGGRDETALLLYNTEKYNKALNNTWTFHELDLPSAERIKELERLTMSRFHREIGSSGQNTFEPLRGALWEAGTMMGVKPAPVAKRVLLFTCDDRPTADVKDLQNIEEKARQLKSNKVALQLFPMVAAPQPGKPLPFDIRPFWKGVLSLFKDDGEDEYEEEEQLGQLHDLRKAVRNKGHKKRALNTTRWRLGGGLDIGIKLYALLQPATKSKNEWVDAVTGERLVQKTALVDKDTGASLPTDTEGKAKPLTFFPNPKDYKRNKSAFFPKVFVTKEEVSKVKAVQDTGLTLLGFKPLAALKDYHQFRSSTFIYPDEKSVHGSTAAFAALQEVLVEREAFALCCFTRLASSEPRLVAAVPQEEMVDAYKTQIQPPGFNLIHLPFADDLRSPEMDRSFTGEERGEPPTEAQVAAARSLLESLDFDPPFDCTGTPNPAIQRHYEVLECLALRDEEPSEEPEDQTVMDLSDIADSIQQFKDAVYGVGYTADIAPPKGTKRKAAAAAPAADNAALAEQVQALDFPGRAAKGDLTKLKNDDLKLYCTLHGLPKSGNKTQLIERIMEHLQQAGAMPKGK